MKLPAIVPPPGRMTEAEARVVGKSANRLAQLRNQLGHPTSGNLTFSGSSVSLTAEEVQAILALLIEREATLLTSFDIILDQPAA